MQNPLYAQILTMAEPFVKAQGLEVWGLELVGAGRLLVRLYVETPENITQPQAFSLPNLDADCASEKNSGENKSEPENESASLPLVGINECTTIAKQLGFVLETEDIIDSAYTLEVSSPGLERVFFKPEQLKPYVGQQVEISLNIAPTEYKPRKKFMGKLLSLDLDNSEVMFTFLPDEAPPFQAEPLIININWSNVKKVHLIHDFEASKGKKQSCK